MFKWSASITMAGLSLGGLLLIAGPAAAQGFYGPGGVYAPGIDQREAFQQQRIERGVESGALTPGETRYLEREQSRIQRAEDRMSADGNLSPMERQRLRGMQERASRDIYRLEHNNRTAGGWGGNNYQGWGRHTNTHERGNHYGYGHERGNHYGYGGRGDYAWQGYHHGSPGNYPGSTGYPQGWRGNGNTPPGTAQNTPGWRGNGTYTGHGNYPGASGTAPGTPQNTQGWRGNGTYAGHGNYPGAGATGQQYQQPRPQIQQARPQMQQPTIRPNANMLARQPSTFGRMATRAGSVAPRRR